MSIASHYCVATQNKYDLFATENEDPYEYMRRMQEAKAQRKLEKEKKKKVETTSIGKPDKVSLKSKEAALNKKNAMLTDHEDKPPVIEEFTIQKEEISKPAAQDKSTKKPRRENKDSNVPNENDRTSRSKRQTYRSPQEDSTYAKYQEEVFPASRPRMNRPPREFRGSHRMNRGNRAPPRQGQDAHQDGSQDVNNMQQQQQPQYNNATAAAADNSDYSSMNQNEDSKVGMWSNKDYETGENYDKPRREFGNKRFADDWDPSLGGAGGGGGREYDDQQQQSNRRGGGGGYRGGRGGGYRRDRNDGGDREFRSRGRGRGGGGAYSNGGGQFGTFGEEGGEQYEGGGGGAPRTYNEDGGQEFGRGGGGFRGGGYRGRGGRGRGGGFRGGGGRDRDEGGSRGGRFRGGGFRNREFDRHSGSDVSRVKAVDKKDGAGFGNWGTFNDDIKEGDISTDGDTTFHNKSDLDKSGVDGEGGGDEKTTANSINANDTDGAPNDTDAPTGDANGDGGDGAPAGEKTTVVDPTEEVTILEEALPPPPEIMTLDEYKLLQEKSRMKADLNLRKAGEGETSEQWANSYALPQKKVLLQQQQSHEGQAAAEEYEEDDEEHAERFHDRPILPKSSVIPITYTDSRRGPRGGGGGGGGYNDRGGGAGGGRDYGGGGGFRGDRDYRDEYRGSGGGGGGRGDYRGGGGRGGPRSEGRYQGGRGRGRGRGGGGYYGNSDGGGGGPRNSEYHRDGGPSGGGGGHSYSSAAPKFADDDFPSLSSPSNPMPPPVLQPEM